MSERERSICRRGAAAGSSPGALATLGLCALLLTLGCDNRIAVRPAMAAATADAEAARRSLVAMARLEPASRVINLGSPSDDIVDQVLVQEGDKVEAKQVLVLLKNYSLRIAELQAARLDVEAAGLLPLQVEAQEARVRSIEAELEYARGEVGSQKGLSEKGFSAGKEFRDAQLHVKRAQEDLNEARAELQRLQTKANLEQRRAENHVFQAEARLERTLIRAPIDARVLRVQVTEGERTGNRTLVSLGATQTMYAAAEVHANDIRLVEAGQSARFSSPALPEPIDGVVESVGSMIFNNYITGEDPTAPKGLRVVQVRVRLEAGDLARKLTNLEGQVRIFLDDATTP